MIDSESLPGPSPRVDLDRYKQEMEEAMTATVAELTPPELRALIQEVVRETLTELLGDPDEGLEVRPEFQQLIEDRWKEYQKTGESLSLDEAFAGLDES